MNEAMLALLSRFPSSLEAWGVSYAIYSVGKGIGNFISVPSRGLGGVLHNFEREFGWDDTVSDPSRGMSGFLH